MNAKWRILCVDVHLDLLVIRDLPEVADGELVNVHADQRLAPQEAGADAHSSETSAELYDVRGRVFRIKGSSNGPRFLIGSDDRWIQRKDLKTVQGVSAIE